MKGTKAASRYAQALLELATENSKVDVVQTDMNTLLSVVNENREFENLLKSPIVKADKKISIFNAVFNGFDQISTSFVTLIVKNRRENILPQIAMAYKAKLQELKGIVPITITTASKLDDSVRAQILANIERSVKGTLEVEEKIDESLVGGFVVRMGDTQIDASVSRQFKDLKQRLTR
ncbi:MAG: ATP synthase F1 subunit delta [Lishizhenia sp.]